MARESVESVRIGKEKVYGWNDLSKSLVLSSEWKTDQVWEDASGDSEDGDEDDDELPCVIGKSEGDCIRWGSRRSVESSFHIIDKVQHTEKNEKKSEERRMLNTI